MGGVKRVGEALGGRIPQEALDVECDRRLRVAEHVLAVVDVRAVSDSERGGGVPEVVRE
jgi:hypothetical protein